MHNPEADLSNGVVIVGGGLAGLTAAVYLARAGISVQLFEKSGRLGGRAITRSHNDYLFNLGAHAFYINGAAYRILKSLNIKFTGGIPGTKTTKIVYQGQIYDFPIGTSTFLKSRLFNLSAKKEVLWMLARMSSQHNNVSKMISVNDWLQKKLQNPVARHFFSSLFRLTTYTNAPELQSAFSAISQLQKSIRNKVLYLDGGWQTLVDRLRDAAVAAGVKIFTSTRVSAIKIGKMNCDVQLADGKLIQTTAILLATSPQNAAMLLKSCETGSLSSRLENLIPVKAACLDLALEQLPAPQTLFAIGIDTPLYFSVHSASAKLSPQKGATVQLVKYLNPNKKTPSQFAESDLEAFMDLLQPGWRQKVVYRSFLPNMTVSNALICKETDEMPKRLRVKETNLPNIYFAGDWVDSEEQLADAAVISAKKACDMILALHGTREKEATLENMTWMT